MIKLKDLIIQSRANLIIAALNGGDVEFYGDPQPVKGQSIGIATLLATVALQNPCGTVSSGVITFNLVDNILLAIATGQVTWCRMLDSVGDFVIDGDCGDNVSNAFFKFDDVNFIAGGRVNLNSIQIIEAGI